MLGRTIVERFRHFWGDLTRPMGHSEPAKQPTDEFQSIYRGLFEQSHNAIFISDLQANYLHANRRARELLGYAPQEIEKVTVEDVSAEASESRDVIKRLLAGEHIPPYERRLLKKDGTSFIGEINVELVYDANGKPLHIQTIIHDIQQSKQSQERLHRQNDYLTALHRITLDLLNRRDRNDLLQSIINYVSEILDAPYVEIRLGEGDELVTYACTENQAFAKGDRGKRDQVVLTWQAYDTQKVVTVDDYSASPLRRKMYDSIPFRAVAYFPIIAGENCLGVLDLSRVEPNKPFTAEEIQQGTLFAQLVAILLDNVNLHEAAANEIARRKQTEDSLQASEQRQRALLNAIPDLMFRFDREGRYIDFHARDVELLAYPPDQLIGKKIADILSPDVSSVHMEYLRQVLDTGKEMGYEYALMLKDQLSHFESRMVKSGQDEVLTINRDITERKQSEMRDSAFLQDMKALQEIFIELSQINDLQMLYSNMVRLTQERLKIDRVAIFLIDQSSNELVGTYGVDTEGNIRDESYYRDAITENHWTLPILNSPKHAAFWEETPVFDNGIQVGVGWITTAALWDGKAALGYLVTDNHIHHQPARSYQDELSSLLGSTYGHLIRLKQTQITLHQSQERQRALLAAIPDLMFRFDHDGKFLDYHSSDPKNLAIPPEAFLGRNIRDVMPPDVAALQAYHMKKVLQTGQEAIYEYTLERDGQPAFFEARMVLSGKDELLAIIRDITERKVLEEQAYTLVMETARANVLGQFVQNASHELRTPLSTINTALYLMTKTDDSEKRQVYSDRASDHIRQLSRLLDMVLSMTKLDSSSSLNIEMIDLNDWVRRVVSVAQEQSSPKELAVTFIPDLQLPHIQGDPVWLQEAFGNILDNAIRFTPKGGAITVRTYSHEEYVVIEFTDTGVGISDDALPHIFERFWRQDEAHSTPGFGLGLSIALKIVEMHDGRIRVDTKPGSGSTFKVLLPLPTQ